MVDVMTAARDRYRVKRRGLRWYVYAGTGTHALASCWRHCTALRYASNLLTAYQDGQFVGRSAVCVSQNELICYSPCDKHRGGQFVMLAGIAPPIRTICPGCSPPVV